MTAVTHDALQVYYGEPVVLQFTITDGAGADQSLVGATASYRIARNKGEDAILEKTVGAGITIATNVATVRFETEDVLAAAPAESTEFWGELWITISGDPLVVADGIINIRPTIQI